MPREIQLRDRHGLIRACAIVDDEDYERLNVYRWSLDGLGYATRRVSAGEKIKMHRDVLGLVRGDGLEGDHKDRTKKLDNRKKNLRIVTHAQNQQNRAASGNKGSSSKFRGVCFFKRTGKWVASVTLNGKSHHLGYFTDEEEAARVAAAFRAEHMPYSQEG